MLLFSHETRGHLSQAAEETHTGTCLRGGFKDGTTGHPTQPSETRQPPTTQGGFHRAPPLLQQDGFVWGQWGVL